LEIEQKSIEFIPLDQRHGSVKSLMTVWFGSNTIILTITTGAIAPSLGLNLAWCLMAILIGNLLGGLFMAFHSAQGPHLGIPQMIQSRAQFGVIGAIVPLILVIIMYIGYFASNALLAGQAFSYVNISLTPGIILASIISLLVCIYGYDAIHFVEKWVTIICGIAFVIITWFALQQPLPVGSLTLGSVSMGSFLLALSIYATWQISYAPYVADYSRYLPEDTSISATFWYTYCGSVISSAWLACLGALLFITIPTFAANAPIAIASQWKLPLPIILYITMIVGIVCTNSLNLYGAFMSTLTTLEPFTKLKGTRVTRITIVTIVGIIGTIIAIWGSGNFLAIYSNFLLLLLYFMIPWTSINLIDYYFVKRGKYSIADIFNPKGIYGRFNWRSLGTYFATVIVEIPFMNTTWYQGSFSVAMGGADIAWIIGGLFAAIVYYLINLNVKNTITDAKPGA